MKLLRSIFLLSSLFSLSLFAQHGGGGHGGGGGYHGGGGGMHGGGSYGGGFRGGYGGYGGYRGGYYGGYGYRGYGYGGFGYGFGFGLGFGWPYYGYGYGYPYYGGGYPYYGYGYPAAPTYAPAAPAPTYSAPAAPTAPATQEGSYYKHVDYYLIVFNDHNIRAALSYQVIGDQIEWTPQEGGAVQRAPLSSVNKSFSVQINRDRRVQFSLP